MFEAIHRWLVRFMFAGAGGLIGASARIDIYESLDLYQSNGVLMDKAVGEIYKVESKDGKKRGEIRALVLLEMGKLLNKGKFLSVAMERWVPDQEVQRIRAGEKTGDLGSAFKDIVRVIESKGRIIKAAAGGLAYPIFLTFLTCQLLNQIATKMVPQFSRLLPPDQWTGAGLVLRWVGDYVSRYGLITAAAVILAVIWTLWSLPNLADGRLRRFLDKLPPWSIYRMLHGSLFLMNLAVLLGAGVKLQDILFMMMRTASPWLRTRLKAIEREIGRVKLGQAMANTGYDFPDERAVAFLRLLSEQDGFDEKLAAFADRWLIKSEANIKMASQIVLYCGIALVGSVIMLVLAGVFSLQSQAQMSLHSHGY